MLTEPPRLSVRPSPPALGRPEPPRRWGPFPAPAAAWAPLPRRVPGPALPCPGRTCAGGAARCSPGRRWLILPPSAGGTRASPQTRGHGPQTRGPQTRRPAPPPRPGGRGSTAQARPRRGQRRPHGRFRFPRSALSGPGPAPALTAGSASPALPSGRGRAGLPRCEGGPRAQGRQDSPAVQDGVEENPRVKAAGRCSVHRLISRLRAEPCRL